MIALASAYVHGLVADSFKGAANFVSESKRQTGFKRQFRTHQVETCESQLRCQQNASNIDQGEAKEPGRQACEMYNYGNINQEERRIREDEYIPAKMRRKEESQIDCSEDCFKNQSVEIMQYEARVVDDGGNASFPIISHGKVFT